MKNFTLYTDGACKGNPGPGGRGFILLSEDNVIKKMSGAKSQTTNNEMELSAVLFGIKYVCQTNNILENSKESYSNGLFSDSVTNKSIEGITLDVYLDSQYVRQGVLDYLQDWKKRGRKTSRKKLIKNIELRQELDIYLGLFLIQWHWVKGHNGNTYNEMADVLASSAIDG